VPHKIDRPTSDNIDERRKIKDILRNAVHRTGSPAAVAMSTEVRCQDPEIREKGSDDPVPTARVVAAAVDKDQVRLAVIAPVPEVELQTMGVVVL